MLCYNMLSFYLLLWCIDHLGSLARCAMYITSIHRHHPIHKSQTRTIGSDAIQCKLGVGRDLGHPQIPTLPFRTTFTLPAKDAFRRAFFEIDNGFFEGLVGGFIGSQTDVDYFKFMARRCASERRFAIAFWSVSVPEVAVKLMPSSARSAIA